MIMMMVQPPSLAGPGEYYSLHYIHWRTYKVPGLHLQLEETSNVAEHHGPVVICSLLKSICFEGSPQ